MLIDLIPTYDRSKDELVLFSQFKIHPEPKELFIFREGDIPFEVKCNIMMLVFGKVQECGYFQFSRFDPFKKDRLVVPVDDPCAPHALLHANPAIAKSIEDGLFFWVVRPLIENNHSNW